MTTIKGLCKQYSIEVGDHLKFCDCKCRVVEFLPSKLKIRWEASGYYDYLPIISLDYHLNRKNVERMEGGKYVPVTNIKIKLKLC